MSDLKLCILAIFSIFFSSIEAINPYLQLLVLLLTVVLLVLNIYKQIIDF